MGFLGKMAKIYHEGVIKPYMLVHNLLDMDDGAAMTHLNVLVPQLHQDGKLGEFIAALHSSVGNYMFSEDKRRKARVFALHAEALARNLGYP